jgi:thiamine biosynthesis lipoprotein
VRRWRVDGVERHHIVDPRTGRSAPEVWRTASVAAATCADANAASTAAIVLGEAAPAWLSRTGLAARLVRQDGDIVSIAGWPAAGVER